MDNHKELSLDINRFIRKLRRKYSDLLYLYIKEPQKNGSFHVHFLVKRKNHLSFSMTENEIRDIWRKGYEVDIRPIFNIDKLCWYFDISKNKNKVGLIKFYPKNIRIFGHSKEMTVVKQKLPYNDVLKIIDSEHFERVYQSTIDVLAVNPDGSKEVLNTVVYQQYKKKDDEKESDKKGNSRSPPQ